MMGLKHKIMKRLRAWCQACQKREVERLKSEQKRLESQLFVNRLELTSKALLECGYQKPPTSWERWLNGEIKH